MSSLADMADKLTRNEILSTNEFRTLLGYKPSDDPKADQLINKNLKQDIPYEEPYPIEEDIPEEIMEDEEEIIQNGT